MEYCPHCRTMYDDDNDTQPCCSCGHPIVCCSSPEVSEPADDLDGETADFMAKAEAAHFREELNKVKR